MNWTHSKLVSPNPLPCLTILLRFLSQLKPPPPPFHWQLGLTISREDRRSQLPAFSSFPAYLHLQLHSTFPSFGPWVPAPNKGQPFPLCSRSHLFVFLKNCVIDFSLFKGSFWSACEHALETYLLKQYLSVEAILSSSFSALFLRISRKICL